MHDRIGKFLFIKLGEVCALISLKGKNRIVHQNRYWGAITFVNSTRRKAHFTKLLCAQLDSGGLDTWLTAFEFETVHK